MNYAISIEAVLLSIGTSILTYMFIQKHACHCYPAPANPPDHSPAAYFPVIVIKRNMCMQQALFHLLAHGRFLNSL